MAENGTIRVLITGRVQGVGFRYFAQERARFRGLVGYACNLANGTVEVKATGPRESLEALVGDLRQGPRSSSVRECAVEWVADDTEAFSAFAVRY